ncbi:MAG: hypothetical protein GXO83_01615 [Chlorobi bacterium]|nr:hypothetical protein [Chlorobiota bacterium]
MRAKAENFREKLAGLQFPGMKVRTLQLDRMIAMVDHLDEYKECLVCRNLLDEADHLTDGFDPVRSYESFESEYLDLYARMLSHLKEDHGLMMPGHYRNLYALIMMIAGALAGALMIYMGRSASFGHWSYETGILLGWVIGLVSGMLTGHKKDRVLKNENKILFN